MTVVLSVVVGGLYAVGVYLLLRRNLAKLIIGLALLTNAANLLIFTVGGLTRARPPLVPEDGSAPAGPVADPLPQALILTAIVIGFGVLAFAMVLAYRANQTNDSDDLDALRSTDYVMTDADPDPTETYDEEQASDPQEAEPVLVIERSAV